MAAGWRRYRIAKFRISDCGFRIAGGGRAWMKPNSSEGRCISGCDVIALSRSVRRDIASDACCRQIIRSSTSVGANYRAACRAKSDAEMLAKLAIVEEEADETDSLVGNASGSRIHSSRRSADPISDEANESDAWLSPRSGRYGLARMARRSEPHNPQSEIRNPK